MMIQVLYFPVGTRIGYTVRYNWDYSAGGFVVNVYI